jgi:hypothetical protein
VDDLEHWRESAGAKGATSEAIVETGNGGTHTDNGKKNNGSSLADGIELAADRPEASAASIPTMRTARFAGVTARIAVGVLVVATLCALAWVRFAGSAAEGQPASAKVVSNALTVFDASGTTLWRHRFEFPLTESMYDKLALRQEHAPVVIDDVDGDGNA